MAIQDEVINTKNYRKHVTKEDPSLEDRCRRCGAVGETVQHITGASSNLVAEKYKARHDSVAKIIHSAINRKYFQDEKLDPYYKKI